MNHAVVISSAINGSHEIVPRTLFSYRYPLFLLFALVQSRNKTARALVRPGWNFTCIRSSP
ncbi:hypothetical protein MESS2_190002 [Mesorhizobium metallidurans STM 2683]|uniref:Uncharacterized protein n=1 Tax=Mesorhizobium metallidurans STM 2683 TaxID=1297569 RepID=M5EP91_9HYPH|nr:hypothetical protein MESS2_190002 [Mesorhizobium metallidurans STM 2683]